MSRVDLDPYFLKISWVELTAGPALYHPTSRMNNLSNIDMDLWTVVIHKFQQSFFRNKF